MSFFEYQCVCDGYDLRQAREWDRIRTIGFFIFKSVGDKKSQTPSDIMQIPAIDGTEQRSSRLVERLLKWKLEQAQKEEANGRPGTDGVKD